MTKALIVIDVQNEYFAGGAVPLWNAGGVLHNILEAVKQATHMNIPVILVQHVIDPTLAASEVFSKGTYGAAIHPELLALAPDAPW